jgi:hypothetical protein
MKHLKLFESFSDEIKENNKFANDVVEDIKTISYLLEDEGFTIEYSFGIRTDKYDENGQPWIPLFIKYTDYNKIVLNGHRRNMIDSISVKVIGNSITDPVTFQKVLKKSDIKTIDRYIDLLKEHLDYIDPENITKKKTLMGNMDIIVKL